MRGIPPALFIALSLLSLFLAGSSPAAPPTSLSPLYLPLITTPYHGSPSTCAVAIMPLGDSITLGYGSAGLTGYRRPLYKALTGAGYAVNFVGGQAGGTPFDFDRDAEGHPGQKTDFIRDHAAAYLRANRPDVVLLHIGTNDIWGESAETIAADIDGLLGELYRADGDVLVVLARIINLVNPDDLEARVSRLNALLQQMADARIAAGDRLLVVDMEHALTYTAIGDDGQEHLVDMADRLHPNDAGYAKMAAVWEAALRGYLGDACRDAHPPRFVAPPPADGLTGIPYAHTAAASGNPAPTFVLVSGPAGMAVDPPSGRVAWTPPAAGDYPVTLRAENGFYPPAEQRFVIHVADQRACPAEMAAYYRLDEPAAPFADALGGPAAQCDDCPAAVAGRVGGALRFDGLGDGLAVANGGRFDWGGWDDFSLEFWLRRPGACGGATFDFNEVIAGRADPAGRPVWWLGVSCQHGGRARFVLRDGDADGSDTADVVGGTALTGDSWRHVVAVRDVTTLDVHLYVDGTLEAVAPAVFSGGFASGAALDAGWLDLLDGFHLAGTLDELAVYDRVLTAREIGQHHALGQQGRATCTAGP